MNKINIFQELIMFKEMLWMTTTLPSFSEEEKRVASIIGEIIENGKMFIADHKSDFQPMEYPVVWQNLPFPIMYIVFNEILYCLTQEHPDSKIMLFIAMKGDNMLEPSNLSGEFYNHEGNMMFIAYFSENMDTFYKITRDDKEFVIAVLSDARYLLSTINNPVNAKIEEIKTSRRKCKKGECEFRTRFSVIGLPTKRGIRGKSEHTGRTVSLHDRRGHYRKLSTKTIWVRPCKVGSVENGITIQQYKIGAKK